MAKELKKQIVENLNKLPSEKLNRLRDQKFYKLVINKLVESGIIDRLGKPSLEENMGKKKRKISQKQKQQVVESLKFINEVASLDIASALRDKLSDNADNINKMAELFAPDKVQNMQDVSDALPQLEEFFSTLRDFLEEKAGEPEEENEPSPGEEAAIDNANKKESDAVSKDIEQDTEDLEV